MVSAKCQFLMLLKIKPIGDKMAKKKHNPIVEWTQQSGHLSGTWEVNVSIEREQFNNDLKIIQKQQLVDYLMGSILGDKIKALEEAFQAEMIAVNTTYRANLVVLTVILLVTDPQTKFSLTLGSKLI
jgi:ribosomal protein L6P/L9E